MKINYNQGKTIFLTPIGVNNIAEKNLIEFQLN